MFNRLYKSFGFAFEGIFTLFKETPNARIHFTIAFIVVVLGAYLSISTEEWLILILCIGFVISAEGFNTAIETITDLTSPNIHPLAKKTKDMAAGAVLIAAITAMIIGSIVFIPKIYSLITAL